LCLERFSADRMVAALEALYDRVVSEM